MAENNQKYTYISWRIISALEFAALAHNGQTRKGNKDVPYFSHPAGIGLILTKAGAEEDVIIGGILHDVIEDTKFGYDDIKERFGQKVADLVRWVTIPSGMEWMASKLAYLDNLEQSPIQARMISAADMLYNSADILMSMERDPEFIKRNPAKSYTDSALTSRRIEIIAKGLGEDNVLVVDLRKQHDEILKLFYGGK